MDTHCLENGGDSKFGDPLEDATQDHCITNIRQLFININKTFRTVKKKF